MVTSHKNVTPNTILLKKQMDFTQHDTDTAGLTYVYPVISRRAGGVSIGINLNPNHACNWQCVYCQVPNLTVGTAPEIDLNQLESELDLLLNAIVYGTFMQSVPEPLRILKDIAFSGDGESTSAHAFPFVIQIVKKLLEKYHLLEKIKVILITNGSLLDKKWVQQGLSCLRQMQSEIWFKLDSATPTGRWHINKTRLSPHRALQHLQIATQYCPTWIQTCLFAWDGIPPSEIEKTAYLNWLEQAKQQGICIQGVLLYGIARPVMQPDTQNRVTPVAPSVLENWAKSLQEFEINVKMSQ